LHSVRAGAVAGGLAGGGSVRRRSGALAEPGARHPGEYRVHRDGVDLPGHARPKGWSSKAMWAVPTRAPEARHGVDVQVVGR
jgi:hypothetical protein